MNQNNTSRYTIAFLLDSLFEPYEEKIWAGALDMAKELNLNLVCFLGGAFRIDDKENWGYKQAIYELLNKSHYDGIVAIMSALCNFIPEAQYLEIFQRLAPLPVVSIGRPIPDACNILVDNKAGIRQVVAHLIQDHHCKRIAFIRGPEFSVEAEARYQAYQEALYENHLALDPMLVVQGNFLRESGVYAVEVLIDERKIAFDAIVAANDGMAIYAMHELQRRNIRIPDDVAIAGFDDVAYAINSSPPLTTNSQPLFELGCKSIKKILAMIEGAAPDEVVLPTKMVVRRSCGCRAHTRIRENILDITLNPLPAECSQQTPEEVIAHTLENYFPVLGERLPHSGWAPQIVEVFLKEIRGVEKGSYYDVLEGLVKSGMTKDIGSFLWYKVINTFFHLITFYLKTDEELKAARQLQEEAGMFLGKVSDIIQTELRANLKEHFVILYLAYLGLGSTFDEEITKRLIREDLPKLGINNFYLSFYDDGKCRDTAKLFFYYNINNSTAMILDDPEHSYPATQLVPGRFRKGGPQYAYIVMPLHFKEELIGFVLCEIGLPEGMIYETLITQLSATIKGIRLMNEVKQHAAELEKKVQERTAQLEDTQQRLIETAHQAGMAEVSVGVMHNVGNLLNSVGISVQEISQVLMKGKIEGLLKANEMLQSHANDLAGFFASDPKAQLLAEYLWKSGQSLKEDLQRIQEESRQLHGKTELMQEIVQTMQEYAYGNQNASFQEKVDITELIETALKIQESNIRKYKIKVIRDYISIPPILAQKNKLTHVLINLIKNASEAMENNSTAERILSIRLSEDQNENIMIEIGDTGEGVCEENLKKIFTYGFTTKKHGHGFGLHTCANYMSEMSGNISFSSKGPGQGTVFTIVFRDLSRRQEKNQ